MLRSICSTLYVCFIATVCSAQTPEFKEETFRTELWAYELKIDKLTDRRMLIATSSAKPTPDSPHRYELELTCYVKKLELLDGSTSRQPVLRSLVTTFTGEAGRALPWEARQVYIPGLGIQTIPTVDYKVRVDSRPAETQMGRQTTYSNQFIAEIGTVAPKKRVLIGEAFSGEVAEFLLSERDALYLDAGCFEAFAKKAEADEKARMAEEAKDPIERYSLPREPWALIEGATEERVQELLSCSAFNTRYEGYKTLLSCRARGVGDGRAMNVFINRETGFATLRTPPEK